MLGYHESGVVGAAAARESGGLCIWAESGLDRRMLLNR